MGYWDKELNRFIEYPPHIILAWRLMIEWKILCNDESGTAPIMRPKNTPEDRKFWEVQLSYWRNIKMDNIR